jgi:hypothetical protein
MQHGYTLATGKARALPRAGAGVFQWRVSLEIIYMSVTAQDQAEQIILYGNPR